MRHFRIGQRCSITSSVRAKSCGRRMDAERPGNLDIDCQPKLYLRYDRKLA